MFYIKSVNEYVNRLKEDGILVDSKISGDYKVNEVTYDSREVVEGAMFICKGLLFKEEFLHSSLEKGASVYLSEKKYDDVDADYIIVTDVRRAMAVVADVAFDSPYKKIKILGITGTKGKTTTASMLRAILDKDSELTGKPRCGMISSLVTYDGNEELEASLTTPEALPLYRLLATAVDNKLEYLIMEVSSQALKYERVGLVEFYLGGVLNVSNDHISPVEHPTLQDYIESKLMIYNQSKNCLLNMDSKEVMDNICDMLEGKNVISYSLSDKGHIKPVNIHKDSIGYAFTAEYGHGEKNEDYTLIIPGMFNVENALVAIGIGEFIGIPYETMKQALETCTVDGRSEIYKNKSGNRVAIVDYAHNTVSFNQIGAMANELYPDFKKVYIFGAPGNKAESRREDLGTVVNHLADVVYITMEDPAREDVNKINDEVESYIDKSKIVVHKYADRVEAIKSALENEGENVCFLILGKGTEDYQKINGQYVKCMSDDEAARKWIELEN